MRMNTQEQTLIQELISRDTINIDVLEALRYMKKEKVLQVHTYQITSPKKRVVVGILMCGRKMNKNA